MRLIPSLLTAVATLASCSPPATITVDKAYVRLGALPRNPAAAYFTLHGGAQDTTLISVGSTVAIRAEMHESMTHANMASMKPLPQVALPAKAELAFAPGGKHVMLFDVNPAIKRGSNVPLQFLFSDGRRLAIKSVAIAAGDPAPDF